MRVFMLGWEFPPFISGGLGTACYGLTKAMSGIGTDVMFVLPRSVAKPFSTHVRLVGPTPGSPLALPSTDFRLDEFEHVTFRTVDATLGDPYERPADQKTKCRSLANAIGAATANSPGATLAHPHGATAVGYDPNLPPKANTHYAGDLFSEVHRYAALASAIARDENFEVVHAHDWMTFPAGLAVAEIKSVPLVVHVHSTEFDRSGQNIDQRIYDIERGGLHGAERVIAVSHLTKNVMTH